MTVLRMPFGRMSSIVTPRKRVVRWGLCALVVTGGLLGTLVCPYQATAAERLPSLEALLKKSAEPASNFVKPSTETLAPITEPELLPEIVESLPALPEPTPPPVSELAPVDVATLQSTPFWVTASTNPSDFYKDRVLNPEQVKKLLLRARMELAAGDIPMSHSFAEAAAEVEIPLEIYRKRPELVLSEIEYVTAKAHALHPVSLQQEVPPPAEESQSSRLAKDPQAYRALSSTSLRLNGVPQGADGVAPEQPEKRAWRRLSQTPVERQDIGASRRWAPVLYSWEAPAFSHNPLYFEDPQLERYGNRFALLCPEQYCVLQPVISVARFYATVPTLPYQMGIEGNGICAEIYDLGASRPGDCVEDSVELLPFSFTGAAVQGGVTTGLIFLIP